MTVDERLDRIEHITAALAEERRKDRDEYKTLWRDTQRQIDDNTRAITRLTAALAETGGQLGELGIRIRDLATESRAADQRLGDRIAALVSAIGEHVRTGHPQA